MIVINYVEVAEQQQHQLQSDRQKTKYLPERLLSVDVLLRISRWTSTNLIVFPLGLGGSCQTDILDPKTKDDSE